MRDKAYEQGVENIQHEMQLILNELHDDLDHWKARDLLAAQRALQIIIESLIGFSRYIYLQKHNITVSKSRAALDGLLKQGDISRTDYELAIKMIGFRNVLVHDYLDVKRNIIEAIIKKKQYQDIKRITDNLMLLL